MQITAQQIDALRRMAATSSLQEVLNLAYLVLGNPMFYQDIDQSIPFYTRNVRIDDENWKRIVSGSLTMEQVSSKNELEDFYLLYQKKQDVLELPPHPNQTENMKNYMIPLMSGNVRQGCLILTSHSRQIREGDMELFRLVAEMFRVKLSGAISNENIGKSLTEGFLIALLEGRPIDAEYVHARMKALQWTPDPCLYCMAIQSTDDRRLSESIVNLLYALSFSRKHKAVAFRHAIVFIYSSDSLSVDVEKEIPELYGILSRMHLCAGVSSSFSDIMDLAVYYRQAVQALKMGQYHKPDCPVYDFRDMRFECLLDVWKEAHSLDELIDPAIKRLYREDTERNSHLIETLSAWIACGRNVEQTAGVLHVHKNTIRYRLSQCDLISGCQYSKGEKLFDLECALRVIAFRDRLKEQNRLI